MDAVLDGGGTEFLIGCPTLGIRHRVPVERSGKACVIGCTRDDVTRKLQRYKLAVRDVLVEGIDDPITPWPEVCAEGVGAVASGVGIACEIKPRPCPFLPKVLGCEEPINDFLLCIWCLVRLKSTDFGDGWRNSCDVQGHAAEPCTAVSGRSWREAIFSNASGHEWVDGVSGTGCDGSGNGF